jgi:hypothetical protein
MGDVSSTLFEGLLDLFLVYTTGRGWRKEDQRLTAEEFGWKNVSGEEPVGSTHGGSDQHVTQLPDVTRPGILPENLYDLRRDCGFSEAFFIQQIASEGREVFAPLPQRGENEREDVEPMEQIQP